MYEKLIYKYIFLQLTNMYVRCKREKYNVCLCLQFIVLLILLFICSNFFVYVSWKIDMITDQILVFESKVANIEFMLLDLVKNISGALNEVYRMKEEMVLVQTKLSNIEKNITMVSTLISKYR